jgi:hypothetical protein
LAAGFISVQGIECTGSYGAGFTRYILAAGIDGEVEAIQPFGLVCL